MAQGDLHAIDGMEIALRVETAKSIRVRTGEAQASALPFAQPAEVLQ